MISAETIQRYQPPSGDLFQSYAALYGNNGALIIAQAATTGDPAIITDAIVRVKYGERLNESTFAALWHQLSTDPLAAPLDTFTSAVNQVLGAEGVKRVIYLGVAVVGIYFLYKLSKD